MDRRHAAPAAPTGSPPRRPAGPRSAAFLAAVLLAALPGAAHAGCDSCPTPSVLQFDFTMAVPRPPPDVWNREVADYLLNHFAADFANSALSNGSQQCVDFRDGDMVVTGTVRTSTSIAFPPPAGRIDGWDDYLFTGEISREGSGYRVSMVLETTCTRQRVLSTSGTYTIAHESEIPADSDFAKEITANWEQYFDGTAEPPPVPKEFLGPQWSDEVVRLTREAFVPLLPKIREFERRMRDTDTRYTMGLMNGGSMELVPARRRVRPFESVPVTITLTDCDGQPLPGREIVLATGGEPWTSPSHNGRFEEATVTTDASGKATATFTVGGKRGYAVARAGILYLRPSGCESLDLGETVLDVDGTAALYEVRFDYEQSQRVSREATEQLVGGSSSERYRETTDLRMRCVGVWENPPDAQREGVIELSGAPLEGCRVVGDYRGAENSSVRAHVSQPSGGPGLSASSWTRTGFQRRRTRGAPLVPGVEPVDLFFSYRGGDELDSSQFGLQVPFEMKSDVVSGGLERIESGGRVIETPFSDEQSDTSQTTFNASVADSTYAEERASVVVSGAAESRETGEGTVTELSAKLRAVITPVRSLDDAAPRRPPAAGSGRESP